MKNKNKRPKLLSFIAILTIVGGVLGVIRSVPLYNLYISIKQGGILVKDSVRIAEIQLNTPAANTQLKAGDVVVSVNNENIASFSDFTEKTNANRDEEIEIVVERNNQMITVQLTPRTNPPPNEGSVGVLLTNTKIENVPVYKIIPGVMTKEYFGSSNLSTLSLSSSVYKDNDYIRLKLLVFGILNITIGVGIWKLRRWAMYGFLLLTVYSLIIYLFYLLNPVNYIVNQPQPILYPSLNGSSFIDAISYIVMLIIGILLVAYIFEKRRMFKKLET